MRALSGFRGALPLLTFAGAASLTLACADDDPPRDARAGASPDSGSPVTTPGGTTTDAGIDAGSSGGTESGGGTGSTGGAIGVDAGAADATRSADAGGMPVSDAGSRIDASGDGGGVDGGDAGSSAGAFALSSPDHADGAKFAPKFTCAEKGFNGSIQPELQWTAGPAGTKSYAITFIDRTLAGRGMTNGYHWVVYDIPASVMRLPQGLTMPSTVMAKAISGAGSGGAYLGPCPNFGGAGSNTDSYEFTLYALAEATTMLSGTGTTGVRNAEMVLERSNLGKATLKGTSDARPPM